jgi:hypothetical protein
MATPRLRKTLPKDLATLMKAAAASDDYAAVHAAIEACELDARGGTGGRTALMFSECTPALARWLVARGLDVNAADEHGATALHGSAFARFHHALPPAVLIELGADVHRRDRRGHTPLHAAADGKNLVSVELLLAHGADVEAQGADGLSPLAWALGRLSNVDLAPMVPVVRALLGAGATISPAAQAGVRRAAEVFVSFRPKLAPALVAAGDAAIAELCARIGVEPPAPRVVHDGSSPIVVPPGTWQQQHAQLWQLLVPATGACQTVQGEVVRIAGRVASELHRNGGVNWDAQFAAMLAAFCQHVASGVALEPAEVAEAKALAGKVRAQPDGHTDRLAELAVRWVARNPTPVPLPAPGYTR